MAWHVQGSRMQALCGLAYNQLLAAQQRGAHEHAVALATALWQLLPLADQHLPLELTGAAQQAKILLLATQALLDLHSKQPDRWGWHWRGHWQLVSKI